MGIRKRAFFMKIFVRENKEDLKQKERKEIELGIF